MRAGLQRRAAVLTAPLALLALLAAGCASPVAPAPPPGPDVPLGDPASGQQPRLEGCSGFALDAQWPGRHPRAHVPDGWDAREGNTRVRLQGWACERLAWGPFERGPVRLVLETHNQQVAPAPCRGADRTTELEVLQSLWVDDAEVAAYLLAEGLPVQATGIEVRHEAVADDAAVVRWAWGDGAADVQVPAPGGSVPSPTLARRLFWDDGVRVSSLDVVAQWSVPGAAAGPADLAGRSAAVGEFAPPLLLADRPSLPAPANAFDAAHWAATLRHHGDLRCAPPS